MDLIGYPVEETVAWSVASGIVMAPQDLDGERPRPRKGLSRVEFFRYETYLKAVAEHGIVENRESDDLVRFAIEGEDFWEIVFGGSDGERRLGVPVTKEQLPQRVEDVLHASGISEAAIVPVGPWRDVLDLAAFDLATDEDWQDIDAEAALHMNGRDPLALLPIRFHLVQAMAKSILEHGDKPGEAFTVVASDAPLLVEVRNDGTATVRCLHEGVARELVKKLS